MSKLNVNAVEPSTGTDITLGASGDTTTVPSGATLDISASTLTPPATMPASSGVNLTALNASNLGSGTVPAARLSGVGKIGQVIDSGAGPDAVIIGSASFVALTDGSTALAASITPSATSSSVLMMVSLMTYCGGGTGYGISLRRGGVEFYASAEAFEIFNNNSASNYSRNFWMTVDTGISTTSATEYTVFVKTDSGNNVTFQRSENESKIILMEILA